MEGIEGIQWLQRLFNHIVEGDPMSNEWWESWMVPIFKRKGDIQDCGNYRGIKLMSHTMKMWERIVDWCIRANQLRFRSGHSTMEPISILRQIVGEAQGGKERRLPYVCRCREGL